MPASRFPATTWWRRSWTAVTGVVIFLAALATVVAFYLTYLHHKATTDVQAPPAAPTSATSEPPSSPVTPSAASAAPDTATSAPDVAPAPTLEPPSSSPPPPAISWKLYNHNPRVGQNITLRFTITNTPAGSRAVLQSRDTPEGTFTDSVRLPGSAGTTSISAPHEIGKTDYRVALEDASGAVVTVGETTTATVFGKISLSQLLGDSVFVTSVGDQEFRALDLINFDSFEYDPTNGVQAFGVVNNSCNSLHLDLAATNSQPIESDYSIQPFWKVLQQTRRAASATVSPQKRTSLDVDLAIGQDWALRVGGSYVSLTNGYAWCSTDKFERQPQGD